MPTYHLTLYDGNYTIYLTNQDAYDLIPFDGTLNTEVYLI